MVRSAAPKVDLSARAVVISILLFWGGWIAVMSLRATMLGFAEPSDLLVRRCAAAIAGVALTMLFWWGLRFVRSDRPVLMALAALLGAIPTTVAFACANWSLFYGWNPPPSLAADVARWGYAQVFRYGVIDSSVSWFFFFGGWAVLYLFLRAAARSTAAEAASANARLRALRYQINPHFLFNALNTLADLVQTGRSVEADRMILDLSALLRRMLNDADASPDVSLSEEISLQQLYLALEARRFEDRLRIAVDLPPELAEIPVPRLILQPLVENAVKYAVGRSYDPVTIRIAAVAGVRKLTLIVEDDGAGGDDVAAGFGIGLANVRDRLSVHYGDAASLTAGRREEGGFRASVDLPRG